MKTDHISSWYQHRHILVTGGAGFIGSHLCDVLVNYGARINVLDNLSTGSYKNIEHLQDSINFLRGSITSFNDCLQAVENVDTLFHLAAQVSVAECQEAPHSALLTNIQGTTHILEAARLNKIKRVIIASSAAVYGNHEGRCSENTPAKPASTYGYSKLIAEQLGRLYAQQYNLEVISLRFFNVWGTRQQPTSGVLAVFKQALCTNKPLIIFGDGTQTRDFVPVEQVVSALVKAGMAPARYAEGQAFNIGSGKSMSLKTALSMLLKKYPHYNQPITYLPERLGDIKHSAGDCSTFEKIVL